MAADLPRLFGTATGSEGEDQFSRRGVSCGRQACGVRGAPMSVSIATLSISIAIAAAAGIGAVRPAADAVQGQQPPVAPPAEGPASPTRDPITVRGCLEGRWLRIFEHDTSDLSGVRRVRLKGSRSMLGVLRDQGGDYVEITGDLDRGRGDRLDARRKVKVADKTTISIGASAEQLSGPDVTPPDATLVVEAFTVLGERCPKN
jgi:hypothetical protein